VLSFSRKNTLLPRPNISSQHHFWLLKACGKCYYDDVLDVVTTHTINTFKDMQEKILWQKFVMEE
jgi:hypothetical protein